MMFCLARRLFAISRSILILFVVVSCQFDIGVDATNDRRPGIGKTNLQTQPEQQPGVSI